LSIDDSRLLTKHISGGRSPQYQLALSSLLTSRELAPTIVTRHSTIGNP
jgi:hypothetical protein